MAEIRFIDGSVLDDVYPAAGDPEVIDAIRTLLEAALEGKVVSFAAVYRDPAGIGTYIRGQWQGRYIEALGALVLLQQDMGNGMRESATGRDAP